MKNMMIIFILSLISSICFPQLFHPVAMLMMIIFVSFLLIIMMTMMMPTAWLAYVLFLIMLGGLLVLFIYIISLIPSNKMMKFSPFSMIFISLLVFISPFKKNKDYSLFNSSEELIKMTKTYFPSLMMMILIVSIFLLFALLIIVYIAQYNKGPLRINLYG